jgi:hypothetical protein
LLKGERPHPSIVHLAKFTKPQELTACFDTSWTSLVAKVVAQYGDIGQMKQKADRPLQSTPGVVVMVFTMVAHALYQPISMP